MSSSDAARIRAIAAVASGRPALWIDLVNALGAERAAEIGVYKGGFASRVLAGCSSIRTYYMIDPWSHLPDWNKPSNKGDAEFVALYDEAMAATEFAAERRVVLRGRTTEVIDQIPDGSLDFVYIDGDHTLRGITIDLVRAWPKLRPGGWIGGDDFKPTVWQHDTRFEPTFVFPLAVYFAEAVGVRITALPYAQFLIEKPAAATGFAFEDLTGAYGNTSLHGQVFPDLRRRLGFSLKQVRSRIGSLLRSAPRR